MDKITKFLKKLSSKELLVIEQAITQLLDSDLTNLNLKKLKGYDDIYRVRIKDIRIIFRKRGDEVDILEISKRSEKTYKKY